MSCLFNNSNNNNNILNDINYMKNNAFRRNKFSCYYYYLLLYFLLALNYAVRIYYVKCVSRMRLKNQPFLLLVKKNKIKDGIQVFQSWPETKWMHPETAIC